MKKKALFERFEGAIDNVGVTIDRKQILEDAF